MAEFPELGRHCSLTSCNVLDFTPFRCEKCESWFCDSHRFSHGLCHSQLNNLEIRSVHIREPVRKYLCSMDGCFIYEYVRIICPECECDFCLRHLHSQDHNCSEKNSDRSGAKISKNPHSVSTLSTVDEVEKDLSVSDRKSQGNTKKIEEKYRKRMDMISMMRLKSKLPSSNIPDSEQLFLFVVIDDKREPVRIFKRWSIGRCMHEIANELGIKNDSGNPNSEILGMYLSDDDTKRTLPRSDEAGQYFRSTINEVVLFMNK